MRDCYNLWSFFYSLFMLFLYVASLFLEPFHCCCAYSLAAFLLPHRLTALIHLMLLATAFVALVAFAYSRAIGRLVGWFTCLLAAWLFGWLVGCRYSPAAAGARGGEAEGGAGEGHRGAAIPRGRGGSGEVRGRVSG